VNGTNLVATLGFTPPARSRVPPQVPATLATNNAFAGFLTANTAVATTSAYVINGASGVATTAHGDRDHHVP
jgi:hypothetical protein